MTKRANLRIVVAWNAGPGQGRATIIWTNRPPIVRRRALTVVRTSTVPVVDRQPLTRPQHRNEVWSADFVFARTTDGRVLKVSDHR